MTHTPTITFVKQVYEYVSRLKQQGASNIRLKCYRLCGDVKSVTVLFNTDEKVTLTSTAPMANATGRSGECKEAA